MNLIIKYKSVKFISISTLMVIAFIFLHSEFGLLEFHEGDHGSHDYCQIVQAVSTNQTVQFAGSILKLKIDKSIRISDVFENNEYQLLYSSVSMEFNPPQKTTETYLFNRTFLI